MKSGKVLIEKKRKYSVSPLNRERATEPDKKTTCHWHVGVQGTCVNIFNGEFQLRTLRAGI